MPDLDDGALATLAQWLEPRLGGPVDLSVRGSTESGFSSDNLVVSATTPSGSTDLLVRFEPADESPYPEQAPGVGTGLGLQHLVATVVGDHLPVAPRVGLEEDAGVLGAQFVVMRYVDGVVPKETPPCTLEGFYAEAPASLRTAMHQHGIAALARFHSVPWRDTSLAVLDPDGTAPGAARQLELVEAKTLAGLAGRTAPVFEEAVSHLRSFLPSAPQPADVVLLWGDARLGNVIWDGATGEVRCVTDFEGAAVGEAALDVGWWLMADRWMHEGSGVDRLPGEPTRPDQVATYERIAGVTLPDLHWYEVFAAYRFSMTVVHVMRRWEAAGLLPSDHTIWRDNPATELLVALLAERS